MQPIFYWLLDFKTRIFDLVVILCHSFLVEKQGEDIWYIWGLVRTATVSWRDTRWTVGLQAVNSWEAPPMPILRVGKRKKQACPPFSWNCARTTLGLGVWIRAWHSCVSSTERPPAQKSGKGGQIIFSGWWAFATLSMVALSLRLCHHKTVLPPVGNDALPWTAQLLTQSCPNRATL